MYWNGKEFTTHIGDAMKVTEGCLSMEFAKILKIGGYVGD